MNDLKSADRQWVCLVMVVVVDATASHFWPANDRIIIQSKVAC